MARAWRTRTGNGQRGRQFKLSLTRRLLIDDELLHLLQKHNALPCVPLQQSCVDQPRHTLRRGAGAGGGRRHAGDAGSNGGGRGPGRVLYNAVCERCRRVSRRCHSKDTAHPPRMSCLPWKGHSSHCDGQTQTRPSLLGGRTGQ